LYIAFQLLAVEHRDPLADADIFGHIAMVVGRDDGDVLARILVKISQGVMRFFQREFAAEDAEGVEGDGAVVEHDPLDTHFLIKAVIARRGHHLLGPNITSPLAKEVLHAAAVIIGNSAFYRLPEFVLGQGRGQCVVV